ncbi:MAG: Gfo/Idh/MocA family oxidoreductase [Oscillospiraceae bacterium]|nr:Gfo/Idh/MocA family oxidoreductase [Oscillospiraceae bacterium]
MKVGFIGAGRIAVLLAETLREMENVTCYAVAARDLGRAQAFAAQYGFEKAYGSYEEMLQDPEVELVYVATPHSHHYEHMKLCIDYGKPILCEKAFTMNADQARKIQAYAKEKGVYVAEAIWTRYMPSRKMIDDVLASGIIGKVNTLTANLSYAISNKERIMRPELAGGALLDIGIYGLNFALMHFGDDIESVETSVQFTDTGVDAMETITIFYADGRMAVLTHSIYARSDRKGIIHGEKGYVVVENINNPQSISVYDDNDCLLAHYDVPKQISGYEYEFIEAAERIRAGELESASMPMDTTVWVMDLMDSIRKSWGMVYPQEKSE